jgi:hypothetical protein
MSTLEGSAVAQTNVQIINEAISGDEGEWNLCFQWCRYIHGDGEIEFGYRFIWRWPEGKLQPARGQARIPSIAQAKALMDQASAEGWGDHDGDALGEQFRAATARLQSEGCVVAPETGYVGWPNREAAMRGNLTPRMIEDEKLLREGKA